VSCRRGLGAVCDALNCGEIRIAPLRTALASLPLRGWPDGRIRLAWLLRDLPVEVAGRLRSDRVTYSPPAPAQSAACGRSARPRRHRPVRRRRGQRLARRA
jgi:hypothetical protein